MKKFLKLLFKPFLFMAFSLGCLFNLHAYVNGYCKYCHKKDPNS